MPVAELIVATLAKLDKSDSLRAAALWGVTALLAVAFLALLISDQVHAASF
jgi:hypothetical protein